MDINKAINHLRNEVIRERKEADSWGIGSGSNYEEREACLACADQMEQVAQWLEDYKRLRTMTYHQMSFYIKGTEFRYYEEKLKDYYLYYIHIKKNTVHDEYELITVQVKSMSYEQFVEWCKKYVETHTYDDYSFEETSI